MTYLVDTHVLLWRLLEPRRLSRKARDIFSRETERLVVPTVVMLEIQYLVEIGKVEIDLNEVLEVVQADPRYRFIAYDEPAMLQSLQLTSTRDPFDRVILSHALARGIPILTRDRWMHRQAPHLAVY